MVAMESLNSSTLIRWVVHQFVDPILNAPLFSVCSFVRHSPNDHTPGGSQNDLLPVRRPFTCLEIVRI
ncbi:hypothetical protein C5167_044050 [Papaver somniferum]|uniref:Uncharacterized protein n=1 Tax=Papaver somniferum TaxID=3469 RepID=A0A4Y7LAC7_PAPSO|nr:hypothetical protein C5167_044050 [Papaver somniferum]